MRQCWWQKMENLISITGDWFDKLQSCKYYASDEKNKQLIWTWKDFEGLLLS